MVKTATLFIVLLFLCINNSSAGTLYLSHDTEYYLAGNLEMFVDKSGQLQFKDVISREYDKRFIPVKAYINRSYTNDTVWVRFSVNRSESFPPDSYLRLWPPYLDHVDIHVQNGHDSTDSTAYTSYQLGDHIPAMQRPVLHPEILVPLVLPLNENRMVYIRVLTSSSLQLTGSIHTTNDLLRHLNPTLLLHGGYLSIAAVIIIINLIFFMRLRDRLYLYFALYVVALFINHFATSGVISIVMPKIAHIVSDYCVGIGSGSALIFFSLFGTVLFKTKSRPGIHLFFQLMVIIGTLTALSVPFNLYNRLAPFQFAWSLLVIVILTWFSLMASFRNESGGKIYLAAFGASNIAYSVQFMRLLGMIDVAWWNIYALQVGSILNMVLMTLAHTERLHNAELAALQTMRNSEAKALELANEMTIGLKIKHLELEDALESERQTIKLKERFVAMLNHEYRTPLAIIQANIAILEIKTGSANTQLMPIFIKIRRAMDRLVEVMETSLARERQAGADGKNNYQPIMIEPIIRGITIEADNLWQGRHLHVSIPMMTTKAVIGDAILLKTVFLNLLDNAFKYSPSDKPVEISVQPGKDDITISITDHGYGIPADQLDMVFNNNYRIPGATSEGAGIGLYLVKSVIEQHGGTIILTSTLNAGTTATIKLPLINKKEQS